MKKTAAAAKSEPGTCSLYLLCGDEFLIRQESDRLVKEFLPDAAAGLNFLTMDGASPREVASELATMPLFPGRKWVRVYDPEFIAPKKGRTEGLNKAKDAWKAGRRKDGARRLLAIAARAGWGAADLDPGASGSPSVSDWNDELGIELAEADIQFLREVAAYCREERISAPEGDVSPLLDLFEKGLPEGHALLLVATEVDRKNPLVKLASEVGQVLERKGAERQKDVDVSGVATELLRGFNKKLSPGASAALKDRVGGNMRLMHSELEKLALYSSGTTIEAADVELLVGRSREEEYLELTDALQKRDFPAARAHVEGAISQGTHGLPLLGTVTRNVRVMLESRVRLSKHVKGAFRMGYNEFKDRLFPEIEKEAQAAGTRVPHPYASYVAHQAAARFTQDELLSGLSACADADLALKSSTPSLLVLERLLLRLLVPAR